MFGLGIGLYWLCQLYIWILIGRMIISWIPMFAPTWRPSGAITSVFEIIYTLTDPPIKFMRRFVPPLNLGGVSLDLGFMLVFIAILVLQRLFLLVF